MFVSEGTCQRVYTTECKMVCRHRHSTSPFCSYGMYHISQEMKVKVMKGWMTMTMIVRQGTTTAMLVMPPSTTLLSTEPMDVAAAAAAAVVALSVALAVVALTVVALSVVVFVGGNVVDDDDLH